MRDQSGEWKVARVRAARSPAAVRHASDADRHRAGVGKTPGEDVRDWSRGEDARAFSPGGSEIRRLRDLTSKSLAWVRACASASGPPHGPTPHRLGTGSFSRLLNAEKILDFFFTRPHWPRQGLKKKPALYGFSTPPAGRYFGRNRGTKNIQRPGKEIRFSPRGEKRDLRDRATSCTSGRGTGERLFSFVACDDGDGQREPRQPGARPPARATHSIPSKRSTQ